jgi:hypothetical protein
MGGAFESRLSEQAEQWLKPGDTIFVLTMNSAISWLVCYLTSSIVSHCAIYIGNGRILHATLSGTRDDPISCLYGPGNRILFASMPMDSEKRAKVVSATHEYIGVPYGLLGIAYKALLILSGRDWPYFRWTFFFDFLISIAVLEIPLWFIYGHAVLAWAFLAWFAIVAINAARWMAWPRPNIWMASKPNNFLRLLIDNGAEIGMDRFFLESQTKLSQKD